MRKPRAISLMKSTQAQSIERFDARLMRSITPATNPALDENPEFGPVKQSRYDAETLRNWSQHFPGCPPPIPCRSFAEFEAHITSTDNLGGQ